MGAAAARTRPVGGFVSPNYVPKNPPVNRPKSPLTG